MGRIELFTDVCDGTVASLAPLLLESLKWETWEQLFLWQLLRAEMMRKAHLVTPCVLLPLFKEPGSPFEGHPEALLGLQELATLAEPTVNVVLLLLTAPPGLSRFATCMLLRWLASFPTQLRVTTAQVAYAIGNGGEKTQSRVPLACKSIGALLDAAAATGLDGPLRESTFRAAVAKLMEALPERPRGEKRAKTQ